MSNSKPAIGESQSQTAEDSQSQHHYARICGGLMLKDRRGWSLTGSALCLRPFRLVFESNRHSRSEDTETEGKSAEAASPSGKGMHAQKHNQPSDYGCDEEVEYSQGAM